MAGTTNNPGNGSRARRLIAHGLGPSLGPTTSPPPADTHSGRRLVLAAGAAILLLWGGLALIFRGWKARYRARARFGATQVAPVVDRLRDLEVPGVDPGAWRDAVAETHAMLATVTGANLLDLSQMQSLREELEQTVSRARANPGEARAQLARIWDLMSDRADFLLHDGGSGRYRGHPRPAVLPPRAPTGPRPSDP